MQYAIKEEDFTLAIDLKVNGNFVVPDDNKYIYTLRDQTGSVLLQEEVIMTTPSTGNDSGVGPSEDNDSINTNEPSTDSPEETPDTSEESVYSDTPDLAIVTVPAAFNTKADGALFAMNIVEVSFNYNKKPYVVRQNYRVVDFYNFTATADDVRNFYGLNSGELPDESVDLVETYLQLLKKHGQTFIDCLNSGSVGNFRANRLITLKTVVSIFPSLRLRANQEENDGSSKFLRYMKFNWQELLDSALSEIEDLENNLAGEEESTYESYDPFFLGAVVDAITGEED